MAARFEDLVVWQRARELAGQIYAITKGRSFARDYALQDQLRRAAASIMSNIAEGFERGSDTDFARFLAIAKGSCGEVRCQLYVAHDQGYVDAAGFDRASGSALEISRMLQSFSRKVRARNARR